MTVASLAENLVEVLALMRVKWMGFVSWIEVWYEGQWIGLLDGYLESWTDWRFDGYKDCCLKFLWLDSYIVGSVEGLLNSCLGG